MRPRRREAGTDDLVVRGARVARSRPRGVDAVLDVRVDGGTIVAARRRRSTRTAIAWSTAPGSCSRRRSSTRTCTCARRAARTRRRSRPGTAAAAAGGYCAILAMPNTDPVVDSTDVLRGLRARAVEEAEVPVGFTAAITVGQQGAQLTEMGELADAGAAAFTDDGRPVATAGLMRRALEYNAITGRPLALHCEEPTLTRGGHMHMGAVSAELGLGGWPSLGESLGVARELSLAGDTGQPLHLMHLSARESVELLARRPGGGRRRRAAR